MNWSNGQLARHSRKRYNPDTTKQRQYFAQAKRRKVTEQRPQKYDAASFIPSYLENAEKEPEKQFRETGYAADQRRRLSIQEKTPQCRETVGQHAANITDATKPKRRHNFPENNEDTIDAKRRKLLQLSDWSGVELQKPVIIEYPESSRSATRTRSSIPRKSSTAHFSTNLKAPQQIPSDFVIKIASQEYQWSPGNNSIKTRQSKTQQALPETPMFARLSRDDISSSTSRSLSSFVTESPCAGRVLQMGRGKENREPELHSVPHTSPSSYDGGLVRAVPVTPKFYQPQPIRRMAPSVYMQLSDSANSKGVVLSIGSPSTLQHQQPKSAVFNGVEAGESKSSESLVAETMTESSWSKISESPRQKQGSRFPNRHSLFDSQRAPRPSRGQSPQSTGAVYDEARQKQVCSIRSSITSPDMYKVTEAGVSDHRCQVPSYKRLAPETGNLCGGEENSMWKRFVFGAGIPGIVESPEPSESAASNGKEAGMVVKLGVAESAPEPPTRMASVLIRTSPGRETLGRAEPTPAPPAATPPQTVSAEGHYKYASASSSNNPRGATSDDDSRVQLGEQRNGLETSTTLGGGKEDELQWEQVATGHMTSNPEPTFHQPSLFVGRLAGSNASGAMAVCRTSELQQDMEATGQATMPAQVVKRWRRRRRDAGRPDIRAFPNIRGDPIEFTP